jgi:CMP-N-acetylneuraminic acid synthetase
MFKGGKVLGIIPARGGSKRLPRKNIRYIAKKPLIAWSIKAAFDSELLDKVVVSTESSEIEKIANECGIGDVINRSDALSNDDATTNEVLIEVLDVLRERGESYGHIVLLQPTSPLRTGADIKRAFHLMEEKNAIGAISVCRTEHPVEWMGQIGEGDLMDSFISETELDKSSQDCALSYQINGAIYIASVDRFLYEKTVFLKSGMVAVVMDRASSVDIDDEYDLQLAAWLLNRREEELVGS